MGTRSVGTLRICSTTLSAWGPRMVTVTVSRASPDGSTNATTFISSPSMAPATRGAWYSSSGRTTAISFVIPGNLSLPPGRAYQ